LHIIDIFHFWNRWGRVGVNGQNICRGPLDLGSAIKEYETKLYDKTVKGDYRILDIVNDDDDGKEETKESSFLFNLSMKSLMNSIEFH